MWFGSLYSTVAKDKYDLEEQSVDSQLSVMNICSLCRVGLNPLSYKASSQFLFWRVFENKSIVYNYQLSHECLVDVQQL